MSESLCPLCGSYNNKNLFTERGWKLIICRTCQLFYIHPYPLNENEVYGKVEEYNYEELEVADSQTHYYASKYFYENYFHNINEACTDAKSVLDVGCGTGRLLELFHRDKPDIHCVGIELNSQRARFAEHIANCQVYRTPIEQFTYSKKFDIITMINVLSHIPSFDNLFNSIKGLLADEGKLILIVGEMTEKVKKDAVFDWSIPDHLHFLGLNTMQYICNKYGYQIHYHERHPFSKELFSTYRWKSPGRSTARNLIKRVVVMTPFALSILAKLYELRHGRNVYSSIIILKHRLN